MEFPLEEFLDVKYEERNNIVIGDSMHLSNSYPEIRIVSPVMPFINGHIPQSEMVDVKPQITHHQMQDYHTDSFLPVIENIEPSIFYPKRFTELAPVKNEHNDHTSSEYLKNGDNVLSVIENNNYNSIEIDLPENSWILADLDAGTQGNPINNEQLIYFNPKLTLNNFSPVNNDKNLSSESGALSDCSSSTSNADNFVIPQNSMENLAFLNTSTSPFLYEYSNQKSPIFENSYFHDYELPQKEFGEGEASVSSPSSCCSLPEDFHANLHEPSENSWVREIRVGKNNRPRGPKCWEFVLRLLQDPVSNPSLVKWEEQTIGSFRLVEKDKISAIWGNRPSKKKNGKVIKYESFARILRYHYKKGKGMVLPVSEKHLVYRFSTKVMDSYRSGKIL